jgi:hypothetical protein
MTPLFEEFGTALGRCPQCCAEIRVEAKREIFFPSAPEPLFGEGTANDNIMENDSPWVGSCEACGIRFKTEDVWNVSWESA